MSRSLPARFARWVVTALLVVAIASVLAVTAFRWLPVPVTAFMIGERLATGAGAAAGPASSLGPLAADFAARGGRRDRRGGPEVPGARRVRLRADREGRGRCRTRPAVARREHDQPAGGQEPVPVARPDLVTQGTRGLVHRLDRAAVAKAANSRGLPEQRAVRPRDLGRGSGKPRLLRQGRRAPRTPRSGAARRRAAEPDPLPRRESRPLRAEPTGVDPRPDEPPRGDVHLFLRTSGKR